MSSTKSAFFHTGARFKCYQSWLLVVSMFSVLFQAYLTLQSRVLQFKPTCCLFFFVRSTLRLHELFGTKTGFSWLLRLLLATPINTSNSFNNGPFNTMFSMTVSDNDNNRPVIKDSYYVLLIALISVSQARAENWARNKPSVRHQNNENKFRGIIYDRIKRGRSRRHSRRCCNSTNQNLMFHFYLSPLSVSSV